MGDALAHAPEGSEAVETPAAEHHEVDIVRRLEEAGEVMIQGRGGDTELVV